MKLSDSVHRPAMLGRNHNSFKTRAVAGLVGVLLAATAAACGGGGGTGQAQGSKTTLNLTGANYCRLGGGGGVSPIWATTDTNIGLAYETLLWDNGPGKAPSPRLATAWKVADGNKSITFTLRKDARFSDGTVLDASALKTWIDYRAAAAGAQYGLGYMGAIQAVDALGKYQLKVTVKAPNPGLAFAFSQGGINWGDVASPKAVAKAQAEKESPIWNQGTFGAGPYMLDPSQSVVGDHCTYVPNPHYYAKSKIKWKKIVTRPGVDVNATLSAMKAGQVDMAQTSTATIADAAKAAGFELLKAKSIAVGIGLVDHGDLNPALGDVRVRQALNFAVDRKTITAALYPNIGTPTSDPDPAGAGLDGYDQSEENVYSFDVDKAKSLLAEAGYAKGFKIKILTAQGGFGFAIDKLAQSVCKYWEAVGVTCDLTNAQPSAFNTERFASKKYSAVANIEGTPPTWVWFNNYMLPGGYGADQHGWTDPTSTSLWETASQLPVTQAATYWKQIRARYVEQAFAVSVASPGTLWVVSKAVGGVNLSSAGTANVLDWYPSGK